MNGRYGLLWWVLLIISALGLAGLGVSFVRVGLEQAHLWAGVIGLFVAVVGLAVSVVGLLRGRPSTGDMRPAGLVRQRIKAGRDAYTAGGDQHFHGPRP